MNRATRRKAMKIPGYRKVLKSTTEKATKDLEEMFRKKWKENDDETLNEGEKDYGRKSGEDEIYND